MALHNRLADKRLLIAGTSLFGVTVTTLAVIAVVFSSGTCACATPPPKFVFQENTPANDTTVIVSNNRGDFRAHTLSVSVDGNTTDWTVHGNATGYLGNDTAVVTGDSYTVTGVTPGDEIRVLWTPENKNESQVMSSYVVGTNGTPVAD